MESKYNYFKRDISWLSFNYRVLLEALDERLPLYERINFISIYSSNLEEFYKIRVADHKAVASGATESDEETVQSARELVEEINKEVTRQLDDRVRIYEQKILPALRKNHIIFYQDNHVEPFHQQFIKDFFREEIFPYLQPVPVSKDKIVSFLRDNRLYLAIRVYPKKEEKNKGEETKENIEKYTGECINERNDGEGIKVWERELDIYGRVKNVGKGSDRSAAPETGEQCFIPFRFQGQYEDKEIGLYYNRFRYYDPSLGQYTQQNPIGLAGGNPTLYGYVFNTMWELDPFGLDWKDLLETGLGHHLFPRAVAKKLGIEEWAKLTAYSWYRYETA